MGNLRKIRWGRNNNNKNTNSNPNYRRWVHMRNRCYLKDNTEYHRYGAKGIRVCDEWISDFSCYDDYVSSLKNALKPGYTIDRINPYGDYEPGNLRWACKTTQARNCSVGSNNKSGVTGVSWCKKQQQWRATIMINRKQIALGRFDSVEEAAIVRKKAEIEYNFYNENP